MSIFVSHLSDNNLVLKFLSLGLTYRGEGILKKTCLSNHVKLSSKPDRGININLQRLSDSILENPLRLYSFIKTLHKR